MNNEVRKETNLEHYKEELKKIFITDGSNPVSVASKIANKLDKNMILRAGNNYYIEDILDWMAQPYRRPILDDAERKYLSAVIKPFRYSVTSITKYAENELNSEYISISVKMEDDICFPLFDMNTMYKGMKAGKDYTLEELGL